MLFGFKLKSYYIIRFIKYKKVRMTMVRSYWLVITLLEQK